MVVTTISELSLCFCLTFYKQHLLHAKLYRRNEKNMSFHLIPKLWWMNRSIVIGPYTCNTCYNKSLIQSICNSISLLLLGLYILYIWFLLYCLFHLFKLIWMLWIHTFLAVFILLLIIKCFGMKLFVPCFCKYQYARHACMYYCCNI